jgi:hypothetical protein
MADGPSTSAPHCSRRAGRSLASSGAGDAGREDADCDSSSANQDQGPHEQPKRMKGWRSAFVRLSSAGHSELIVRAPGLRWWYLGDLL